jgi:plastocyanin
MVSTLGFGVIWGGEVMKASQCCAISVCAVGVLSVVMGMPVMAANVDVIVQDGKGELLADVVVSVQERLHPMTTTKTMAVIDQRQRQFVPYVSVVQTGTTVSFPNSDRIRHHVYSFSPARHFDLQLYAGQPSKPVVFDRAGVAVLGCNIHDWMLAYVKVVSTPFFAKTDDGGQATVRNIPKGRYQLEYWHPRLEKPVLRSIDIDQNDLVQREVLRLTLPDSRQSVPTMNHTYSSSADY